MPVVAGSLSFLNGRREERDDGWKASSKHSVQFQCKGRIAPSWRFETAAFPDTLVAIDSSFSDSVDDVIRKPASLASIRIKSYPAGHGVGDVFLGYDAYDIIAPRHAAPTHDDRHEGLFPPHPVDHIKGD
jgi:hypothetical protein